MSIVPQQRAGYIYWTPPTKPLKDWPLHVTLFFKIPLDDEVLLPRMEKHLDMMTEYLNDPKRAKTDEDVLAITNEIHDVRVCCGYVRHVAAERHIAFAMASHARLGALSPAHGMQKDTFAEVERQGLWW